MNHPDTTTVATTPFAALHRAHGAKMTIFAGYELPLHYTHGILHEHRHTREQASLFDISHMGQLRLHGEGAAALLETLTPSAIATLRPGQQRYTVLTLPAGGVLDDLVVTRWQVDDFFLVVNAARQAIDAAHIQAHLPPTCSLEALRDRALMALQGPKAAEVLARHCPEALTLDFMSAMQTSVAGVPCWLSRSGYTGEDGFELSLPAAQASAVAEILLNEPQVAWAGLGARDTLRLEAGLCLYGHELDEQTTPLAANLDWLIRRGAAHYLGAAIIEAERHAGPAQRLVGLVPRGKQPLREPTPLYACAATDAPLLIGRITSGGFSPSLGHPLALARVASAYTARDSELFALHRGQWLSARVTALPFVPHRYHRKSHD